MINLETLYPYTNESIEDINKKFIDSEFDGIVLPVTVERGRGNKFRVLKQQQFLQEEEFISGDIVLSDFLKEVNLKDKIVFLSVINLFAALGGGGESPEELENYAALRKAIQEVYDLTDKLIINNNLYWQVVARKEFFLKLKKEFPNLDYVYTMFNRCDDVAEYQNIVPLNINCYDIVKYINYGKKIYFPQFERKSFNSQLNFDELLEYYRLAENPRLGFTFKDADITVISKENANKILKRVFDEK